MNTLHIDEFYYTAAEVLCTLYASFPVRQLLLVEDISGPIEWDMTGLPDRKSKACFETFVWLAEHDLLRFRSVEPRDIGLEGVVLTQKGFVLLTGLMRWDSGEVISRIEALMEARRTRAYQDLGAIVLDILRGNTQWAAPAPDDALPKAEPLTASDDA